MGPIKSIPQHIILTNSLNKLAVNKSANVITRRHSLPDKIRAIKNTDLIPQSLSEIRALYQLNTESATKWVSEYTESSDNEKRQETHLGPLTKAIKDLNLSLLSPEQIDQKETQAQESRRTSMPFDFSKSGLRNTSPMGQLTSLQSLLFAGSIFDTNSLMFSSSFQKVADKYNVVIGLRMPGSVGQIHLKEGYPTKNLHVKAKSSATGPTAGFIAAEAKLSKRAPVDWNKQEKDIKDALKKGANLVDLVLSQSQIDSLLDVKAMVKLDGDEYQANYHGEEMRFIISPETGLVTHADGKIVQVLTNPPEINTPSNNTTKPITADYDLFSIITTKNQDYNPRPLQVGQKALRFSKQEIDNMKEAPQLKDYEKSGGKEAFKKALSAFTAGRGDIDKLDKDKGNFHHFGVTIIDALNKKVVEDEQYTGGKLVWHGDEMGNPYSDGFNVDDSPVFFIPHQKAIQVHTKEELRNLYNRLRQEGFSPETSPRFGV